MVLWVDYVLMLLQDTVMSRMYNQSGNLYTGAFDCLMKTVRTEGLLAIYKGYFAHLARILPHTVSFLFTHLSPYLSIHLPTHSRARCFRRLTFLADPNIDPC